MYECAGVLGVQPDPYTLRELVAMAEARERSEWGRVSSLMALVANLLRDPHKGRPLRPADFNPYVEQEKTPEKPVLRGRELEVLRDVFCKGS